MEMDTELMNAYIQKQNRMIGELINKNLMLESQLEVATKKLKEVEVKKDSKEDKAYK
jgi:mevalonate kinase